VEQFGVAFGGCAGTPEFRLHNQQMKYRFAPETYRASGYEDVGWSLVPLEKLGLVLGVNVENISKLIDDWNQFAKINYRMVGRNLEMVLPYLPAHVQLAFHNRRSIVINESQKARN